MDGIGAFGNVGLVALGKPANFVGRCFDPLEAFGAVSALFALHCSVSIRVHSGVRRIQPVLVLLRWIEACGFQGDSGGRVTAAYAV
jgi:hypothetical protein